MNIKTHVQLILQLLVTLAIVAVLVPGAFADSEEEQKDAAAGADASNPTAAVNYQDLRYRYFDLRGAYVEGLIGDDVLSTDAYNKGVGIGLRFMY